MRNWMMAMLLGMIGLFSAGDALADGRRGGDPGAVAAPAATAGAGGVVNVNEASDEQLLRLPGVGPARARQIIEYRKKQPFKRPEELTRIKGIGKKTFAKLRPLVALSGPTTLTERPKAR
jgi:competence ComEA-like helix-hairpin-helix protein